MFHPKRELTITLIACMAVMGIVLVVTANSQKVRIHDPPAGGVRPGVDPALSSKSIQTDIKDIFDQIRPCVVTVISHTGAILDQVGQTNTRLLDPYKKGNRSISSGILISSDGMILTTRDSIPSNQIEIELFRRKPKLFDADILEVNDALDLAVLQIRGVKDLPFCRLGDSNSVELGNIVFAVGSPYGFSETITSGIVSNSRKDVRIEGKSFQNLIQTDAVINDGNSGGPLVDVSGEVVGLNVGILSEGTVYSGIGFAIPINDAKDFAKRYL